MTSVSESLAYEEIMEDIANIVSNAIELSDQAAWIMEQCEDAAYDLNEEDLYSYMNSLIEYKTTLIWK